MRGYFGIGLDNPKSDCNIGSVLRGSGVFGAAFVAVSGDRYKKHSADTMAHYRHMPLFHVDDLRSILPFNCVPVAVELFKGATPLPEYKHPERAFYIFGAEDATLGPDVVSWCRDVVMIPSNRCLNLACAANVVMYDRMTKGNGFQAV